MFRTLIVRRALGGLILVLAIGLTTCQSGLASPASGERATLEPGAPGG